MSQQTDFLTQLRAQLARGTPITIGAQNQSMNAFNAQGCPHGLFGLSAFTCRFCAEEKEKRTTADPNITTQRTVKTRVVVDVVIPAGGATAQILKGLNDRQRSIIGGYVAITSGAARNIQGQIFPKVPNVAVPLSDNDTGSKSVTSDIVLQVDDTFQILVASAADAGILRGFFSVLDEF